MGLEEEGKRGKVRVGEGKVLLKDVLFPSFLYRLDETWSKSVTCDDKGYINERRRKVTSVEIREKG